MNGSSVTEVCQRGKSAIKNDARRLLGTDLQEISS